MAGNPWISFLRGYRSKHPGKSMKQAMKDGAKEYKKRKPAAEKPKRKRKKKST
jgi:hypothetical protein